MESVSIREIQVSYGRKRKATFDAVSDPKDIVKFLEGIMPNNSQEHLFAIYFDSSHTPIGYSIVCTGLLTSCPIHPREIFQRALLLGAYSVAIAHNHPSGNPQPSEADNTVTKQISEASKVLGIRFLYHIVFGDQGYYSFQECGLL